MIRVLLVINADICFQIVNSLPNIISLNYYAFLYFTATKCFITIENKAFYAGTKSKVKVGWYNVHCQRFDSQYPHKHGEMSVHPYYFHVDYLSDVSNFCRDPDYTGKPWCYTGKIIKRWKYCDIPRCSPGIPVLILSPFSVLLFSFFFFFIPIHFYIYVHWLLILF